MPVINSGGGYEADKTAFAAEATFTPVAEAYSAGDVVSVTKEFAGIGPAEGGEVEIRSAFFQIAHTALVASEAGYTLHLYSATPPSALANNAVFDVPAGDRAVHLGSIALGTPVDLGSTLLVETHDIGKQITVPAGGSVFGYLVTAAGITPTAAARRVVLHTKRV